MNHLFNLTKKELRELLTPGAIISVIVMMVIFMSIGTLIGGEIENATAPSKIGVVNGDPGGDWSEFAISSIEDMYGAGAADYVVILESPYGDNDRIAKEMIEKGLNSALGIVPGFSQSIDAQEQTSIEGYYIFSNSGLLGSTASLVTTAIMPEISNRISHKLVSEMTGDASADFLLSPIKQNTPFTYINGEIYEGVTPIEISTSIMSQTMMVPIVIMIIIMIIGNMVIASMGTEKENKTLETLLTMPVNRTTIVSGKLLAAAIVGLVYGMAYMVGMSFYIGGVTGTAGGVNLSDYGLGLGLTDWALIALMIFLAIFCALGLCMILGAFTKNFKAAQAMMLPISVLAMLPMFVTMFSSWSSLPPVMQGVLFAIPFSHPMMVMNNLMFGDINLVLAGVVYLAVFTLVIIMITVRLYKSDILLTGIGQTRAANLTKALVTKRKKA